MAPKAFDFTGRSEKGSAWDAMVHDVPDVVELIRDPWTTADL